MVTKFTHLSVVEVVNVHDMNHMITIFFYIITYGMIGWWGTIYDYVGMYLIFVISES